MGPVLDLHGVMALLDDGDVTEVVLASGQPVTVRRQGSYKQADPAPLSVDDILDLATGTPLASLVERGDGSATLQLAGRGVRVEVNRFGERLMVRMLRGPRTGAIAVERTRPARAATEPSGAARPRSDPDLRDVRTDRSSPQSQRIPRTEPSNPLPTTPRPEPSRLTSRTETVIPPIELRPPAPRPEPARIDRRAEPSPATPPVAEPPRREPLSIDVRSDAPRPEPLRLELEPMAVVTALPEPSFSQPPEPAAPQPARLEPARPESLVAEAPRGRPARITLSPPPPRRTTIAPPISDPLPPLRAAAPAAALPEFVHLVESALRRNATDLHVTVGRPAMIRTSEGLVPNGSPLGADDVDALLLPLLSSSQRNLLDQRGYVDAAIDLGAVARLRMNLSRTRAGLKGAFRMVMTVPPTLEQLALPPELARVTTYHQGLVLIAGPNGHGKTTTLGALIDLINRSKPHHILTVEDPVEIVHPKKRALISQREVGTHTRSFATALKASLREDPDVIVIGELRDRETVEIALTAAETGHLVMATTSTPSAAKTLGRLIDMFPPADQPQVRASLAAALRFVVAQRLLPDANGTGLVAAVELVTGVLPLAAMIRDDKLYQLGSLLQRGRAFGMIRLDDSLVELVRAGRITEQVALKHSDNRRDLENTLRGKPDPASTQTGRVGLFGKRRDK